ncbi:MAG: amidohydrolase [Gemmataceae bacterium]|nr:amidohydrolase [Gemmataceae bacterium]
MTDAHLHLVPPRLPGVGPLDSRLEGPPESVAECVRAELAAAGIKRCIAMGSWLGAEDDPLGVDLTLRIGEMVPGIYAAGVCDPGRSNPDHIRRCDRVLAGGRVRALNVYLGYLPFPPDHANYRPYYELAARHNIPVIFHTGDTYSQSARLRFAHPLPIDDVAVDHPNVRFVIAHFGNPWLTDAAAVIYKNVNVWADLSGLVVGTKWQSPDEDVVEQLSDLRAAVLRAFRYAERPNRFVFGSDWPLVNIQSYRDLIAGWFAPHLHELIFEGTARVLFRFT